MLNAPKWQEWNQAKELAHTIAKVTVGLPREMAVVTETGLLVSELGWIRMMEIEAEWDKVLLAKVGTEPIPEAAIEVMSVIQDRWERTGSIARKESELRWKKVSS